MDDYKRKLIQLAHCREAGWKTIYTILKADSEAAKIPDATYYSPVLPRDRHLLQTLHTIPIDKLLTEYQSSGINVVTIFDEEYPETLKTIFQPPWILFAKGDLSLLKNEKSLAVVGSREATAYGRKAIDFLFPELIQKQTLIISGLAKGIDAHAHKTAIRLGGKTAGVIAGGFNHLYPKENIKLAEYMMEKHLVISEYPPTFVPMKWHFPMRNRIISGLARGTLVVEAKKKSGSLITADYALNEGKEVFTVPGSIFSASSEGVHELIQQGAKLVKGPQEIWEEL